MDPVPDASFQPDQSQRSNEAAVVPKAFSRQSGRNQAFAGRQRPRKRTAAAGAARRLAVSDVASLHVDENQPPAWGCAAGVLSELDPQGLAATYTFDAPLSREPYAAVIRFVGARVGAKARPDTGDRFERVERVDGLTGDSGRVAITARVQGINPGDWRVIAAPDVQSGTAQAVKLLPRRVVATRTTFGLVAQGPSVRLTAWPALVGLGAVVAVVLQALLVARADINALAVLALSLAGCALGLVGAKLWFLVLHRKHLREFLSAGACIQGFLLAALGVLGLGAMLLRLPVGVILDATTPGVFFGMAIGRPGCFLTGCCAGRPTTSRWGRRSSDRRLVIRRYPVQLIEAAAALVLGVMAFVLVLTVQPPMPGAIFVGALAAYTVCRQLLFPLRTESHTPTGRKATMAMSLLVLVAAVVGSVLADPTPPCQAVLRHPGAPGTP